MMKIIIGLSAKSERLEKMHQHLHSYIKRNSNNWEQPIKVSMHKLLLLSIDSVINCKISSKFVWKELSQ